MSGTQRMMGMRGLKVTIVPTSLCSYVICSQWSRDSFVTAIRKIDNTVTSLRFRIRENIVIVSVSEPCPGSPPKSCVISLICTFNSHSVVTAHWDVRHAYFIFQDLVCAPLLNTWGWHFTWWTTDASPSNEDMFSHLKPHCFGSWDYFYPDL